MKYKHMSLDELQRCDTDDLEAMAELGRRFVDIEDPSKAEDTLAGYKMQMETCLAGANELREQLVNMKDEIEGQFTLVFEELSRLETEMIIEEEES